MRKTKFPPEEGWLQITLKMSTKRPLSEDAIKRFTTGDKPEEYEFGLVEQYGSEIRVIQRRKVAA